MTIFLETDYVINCIITYSSSYSVFILLCDGV